MKSIFEYLREDLLLNAGIVPETPDYLALQRSEWSQEFETLMRNRLILGALRYGRLGAQGKPQYDRTGGIKDKLEQYETSGNLECLVDIANIALCEFVEGQHPSRHFRAGDDTKHVRRIG